MRAGARDFLSVLRCGRLAFFAPVVMVGACRGAVRALDDFDRTVRPLIADALNDEAARQDMCDALCGNGMSVDLWFREYTRMARTPYDGELGMLAGAFARLYDDLIDNGEDLELDLWLDTLFRNGTATPATGPQRLLIGLYQEIDKRLKSDLARDQLLALHEYQQLSREQRDPEIPRERLGKIARGKGGMAALAVAAITRTEIPIGERELIMEIGEAFQLLDDYVDVRKDRGQGITTALSRGDIGLAEIGERLRALSPRMRAQYGQSAARFDGLIYLVLVTNLIKRRMARWAPRKRRTPLSYLINGRSPAIQLKCTPSSPPP